MFINKICSYVVANLPKKLPYFYSNPSLQRALSYSWV